MIKLNLIEKINIPKVAIRRKMATFCCNLENTNPKDVFEKVDAPVIERPKSKTIYDLKRMLETPELKQRRITMDSYMDDTLKQRALIPSYEKLFTARNSTLKDREISSIGSCLSLENAKYLDILLNIKSVNEVAQGRLLAVGDISEVLVRLSKISEPRLVEILSDKTLHMSKVCKTIVREEKALGLASIKNSEVKQVAEKFSNSTRLIYPDIYNKFADIGDKMQAVEDLNITSHVNEELQDLVAIGYGHQKAYDKLYSLDTLLDAYHNSKGHYNSTSGDISTYYSALDEKDHTGKYLLKNFLFDRNLGPLSDYPTNDVAKKNRAMIVDFRKEASLEGLKKYINENQKNQPKMADYMYEKYYLSELSPSIKKIHKQIFDEFGTKLFSVENESAPKLVYQELAQWKRAGAEEFIPPSQIDMSQIREKFLGRTRGDFTPVANSIRIAGDDDTAIRYALRHEIMHCNDRVGKNGSSSFSSEFNVIKSFNKYKNELLNAGLGFRGLEDYAYTNKREFVAVASQGEFYRYSQEFKDVLVRLGMPKWVFKLEQTNPLVSENAREVALMRDFNAKYRF